MIYIHVYFILKYFILQIRNVTCPNVSESQKINHNIKEPDLVEHSDKNNNNAKCTTLNMSVANTSEPSEDDKASTGTKDKGKLICNVYFELTNKQFTHYASFSQMYA